jgi:hypothetical protein
MCRQWQQTRLFFSEDLFNGTGIILRPRAPMSHVVTPDLSLTIEILQGGEWASGKEGISYKANRSLDPSLLIASRWPARTRCEVIMAGKFQQTRVKLNLIVTTCEDDTAHVVIKDDPATAVELMEGVHVGAQEVFQTLIEEEAQGQSARVGECDHKAR